MITCSSKAYGMRISEIKDGTLFIPVSFPDEVWLRTNAGGVRVFNATMPNVTVIYRSSGELNRSGDPLKYILFDGTITISN